MPEDIIIPNSNPSLELVREWAFNDHMYFCQQDEDLVLHNTKYTSLSLELACDSTCPKNDYLLSILAYFSHRLILFRDLKSVEQVYTSSREYVNCDPTQKWLKEFDPLRDRLVNPTPLCDTQAIELAKKLLIGSAVLLEFKKTGKALSDYVEYLAYNESYKSYLYLNHKTGIWIHSIHNPLESIKQKMENKSQ